MSGSEDSLVGPAGHAAQCSQMVLHFVGKELREAIELASQNRIPLNRQEPRICVRLFVL